MILSPFLFTLDIFIPGVAQMLRAQSNPFMDACDVIDILPLVIRTMASGRLLPEKCRTWFAFFVQSVGLSPLVATIARFSAFALLLQGSVVVVILLLSA